MRGDERKIDAFCTRDDIAHLLVMLGYFGMPRELGEAVLAEEPLVPAHDLLRSRGGAVPDGVRVLASVGGKYRDEPAVMELDELAVDAGAVVKALEVRLRDELYQIAVAPLVLREENKARSLVVHPVLFLRAGAGSDMEIDADDGLDALLAALLVELYRPVEVAVVGERERLLAVFGRSGNELGDLRYRLKERVV